MTKQTVFSTMLARSPNVPPGMPDNFADAEKAMACLDKAEYILARQASEASKAATDPEKRDTSIDMVAGILSDIGLDAEYVQANYAFFTNWVTAVNAVSNSLEGMSATTTVDFIMAAMPFARINLNDDERYVTARLQMAAKLYAGSSRYNAQRLVKELVNDPRVGLHLIYRGLGLIACDTTVLQEMAQEVNAQYAAVNAVAADPAEVNE